MSLSLLNAARVFRGIFNEALEGVTEFSWLDALATRVDTDQPLEDFRWLGQNPAVQEFTGQRRTQEPRVNSHQIAVRVFDLSASFSIDDIADNKFGMIDRKIAAMPKRGVQHRARRLNQFIEAGDGTSLGKAYDGTTFFSNSHSEGASGTLDNLLAGSAANAAAPTAAEAEKMVNDAVANFYTFKDDQGEPINEDLKSVLFAVPVHYRNAFAAALGAEVIVESGSSRTALARVVNGGLDISLVVMPRLSGNGFYSFRTDTTEKPFIYLVRQDMDDPQYLDESLKHRRVSYIMEGRYEYGFGMWQFAQKTVVS